MPPDTESAAKPESDNVLEFLSSAFYIMGVGCLLYYTSLMLALHQFREKTLNFMGTTFPGEVFNSEAAVLTLTLLCLPLGLLLLLCWLYQNHAIKEREVRPYFPHTIAHLHVVPRQFPWMRVALFTVLLLWPTFVHCFTCGRLFSHYGIIDHAWVPATLVLVNDGEPVKPSVQLKPAYPKALTGAGLLTRKPETKSGRSYPIRDGAWQWINTHRKDELRPGSGDPKDTTRLVQITAFPIVQPWFFLLSSLAMGVVAILLALRGFGIGIKR
jgi:hypothetical protein